MSMIADVGNDGNRNSEGEGLDLLWGLAGAYVVPHKSSILWLLIQVYSCCDGIVTFCLLQWDHFIYTQANTILG